MIIKRIKKSSKKILLIFLKVAISSQLLCWLTMIQFRRNKWQEPTTGIKMVAIVFSIG
jgi:hypothetical protein